VKWKDWNSPPPTLAFRRVLSTAPNLTKAARSASMAKVYSAPALSRSARSCFRVLTTAPMPWPTAQEAASLPAARAASSWQPR
jgi:hypothetical protein